MSAKNKGFLFAILLLLSTPLVLHAETRTILLGSTRTVTGRGTTSNHGTGLTGTSSSYYYQSVHTKGMGIENNSPYCVSELSNYAYHSTSIAVGAPNSSYSGYHVSKHSWYNAWDGHWTEGLYTSHTGQHSTSSNWAPSCH